MIHRYDSNERRHYMLKNSSSFKLKPKLLYAGTLSKCQGWRDESHKHDFLEMLFITEGTGHITVSGQKFTAEKGDLFIYNAGAEHHEISSRKTPLAACFMAIDGFEITNLPKNHLLPSNIACRQNVGKMFDEFSQYFTIVVKESREKEPFYTELAQSAARAILMLLFRLMNKTLNADKYLEVNSVYDSAKAYIDENYLQTLSLDEIAAKCHVNKYHLSHIFVKAHEMSVGQYIAELRLKEAARLLRTTKLPVNEISSRAGFHDPGYFCRTFKKSFACTPSVYRKQLGGRRQPV